MVFIDTNLTYSKQVCDIAVGAIAGAGSVLYLLGRLLIILLIAHIYFNMLNKGAEIGTNK